MKALILLYVKVKILFISDTVKKNSLIYSNKITANLNLKFLFINNIVGSFSYTERFLQHVVLEFSILSWLAFKRFIMPGLYLWVSILYFELIDGMREIIDSESETFCMITY